ncbi:FadR/GntR family transcriptional regulator [soil metagenome]
MKAPGDAASPVGNAPPSPQLHGDRVYGELLALLNGALSDRDKRLPGELELARQFNVSRPVLRQALARLRADGRIYSRKGSGHYVGEPSPLIQDLRFGSLASIPDMQSFLEFRLTIETECTGRAALHRSPSGRQEIRLRRKAFERAIASGQSAVEEDLAFHNAIAQASGNRFFAITLASLSEQTRFGIRLVRDLSVRPIANRLAEVCTEHAAIEAAIDARDAPAARAAMTAHLTRGIARLFGN